MYSALCLPCLPLSGLPAWPWAAFSLEAPGVTTFMGGTLPPPLCRKKSWVRLARGRGGGVAGGTIQEPQALGGASGARTSSMGPRDPSWLHTPAQHPGPLSEVRSKASLRRGDRGTH